MKICITSFLVLIAASTSSTQVFTVDASVDGESHPHLRALADISVPVVCDRGTCNRDNDCAAGTYCSDRGGNDCSHSCCSSTQCNRFGDGCPSGSECDTSADGDNGCYLCRPTITFADVDIAVGCPSGKCSSDDHCNGNQVCSFSGNGCSSDCCGVERCNSSGRGCSNGGICDKTSEDTPGCYICLIPETPPTYRAIGVEEEEEVPDDAVEMEAGSLRASILKEE